MSNLTTNFSHTVGIDIAKSVFLVHVCDTQTGEIIDRQLRREQVLEHFANRAPCLIGMESCGGSQYWARKLVELGHTVRLMDGKLVKPFVSRNKSDRADAEGIWVALNQNVRCVAVKGKMERDIQALLTMRSKLVSHRTACVNHVRGLLMEYGQVIPKSLSKFESMVDDCINALEGDAAPLVIETFRSIVRQIRESSEQIVQLTKEIRKLAKQTRHGDNLESVPGIGVVTMAYMCVLLADPGVFSSARQFAAYLGLVPMHTGSGGKTINTRIPCRCNKALRALLVECAQSVARMRNPSPWVKGILEKKPKKVALIAIANRIARQCWAVAKNNQPWRNIPQTTAA